MKFTSYLILAFLLGAMFVSLFHVSGGMNMSGGMTDCPFMVHEEAVCAMNLTDHMSAWKSVFFVTVSTIVLLIIAVVCITLLAPNLLRRILYTSPPTLVWLQTRIYTFTYRPLQELFSNGILHPKVF